jgi:hypothetical protein
MPMTETLRPAILPDNKRLLYYPLTIGLAVSAVGIVLGNLIMVVLPLIILAVFPGVSIFFHALFHFLVKIQIHADTLVVTDYAGNAFVKLPSRQEIFLDEVSYVYYLEKEINLLQSLRRKLRKFKISPKETDYTRQNLISRYNIPPEALRKFEQDSQKALTDYTATAIFMKLKELYEKYNVPKQTKTTLEKALKDDDNLNFDYVSSSLEGCDISAQDLESLRDEFSNINADVLAPFLLTKVRLSKYEKRETQRHGTLATVRTNVGLVLSNNGGTNKVYMMHFHDLSEESLHRLMDTINAGRSGIRYLMTKSSLNRLMAK